jgi:hypothetical protein
VPEAHQVGGLIVLLLTGLAVRELCRREGVKDWTFRWRR